LHLFSWESCTNGTPLLKKSLAGVIFGVWSWSFDLISPIATYLEIADAGTSTIIQAIGLVGHHVVKAFCIGGQIMVGKSIGQRKTKLAMQYYHLGTISL